jgi:pumilio family protein 6
MPTTTTTKSAMVGTKRKLASVKNGHVKENKKPKFESGLKSALSSSPKSVPKKRVETNDLDSDDSGSESDGGALLVDDLTDLDEEDEDEGSTEEEEIPKVEDGLQTERAKAAATNSKSTFSC